MKFQCSIMFHGLSPIRNISYLLPMCCSFWEKCINSQKNGLGCSTPLNEIRTYYVWISYANAYGQKPHSWTQRKRSLADNRCNTSVCMTNQSTHLCYTYYQRVCAWPIKAEFYVARRCYASVVKVIIYAALRSWRLWLFSRVCITNPNNNNHNLLLSL